MKNYMILILFCSSCLVAQQQSNLGNTSPVYKFSKDLDLTLVALSTTLNISSFILKKNVEPITIEEINQLNTSDIWKFERKLTENWDKKSITASDAFLYASICNPVLLYLQKDIRKDVFPVSLIWLETMTLNLGLTNLTKTLLSRKRPYLYGNKASLNEKQKNDNQRSFFSGHTSTTAASWFMLAKIYQDYYPQDKRLPYIWSFSATVPAITAYLRVKGGKHFYTDVITGYLVGAAVGLIVPELHKTDNRFSTGMAMLPNSQLGMRIYFVINTNL
tara:strand:- start:3417 stop:4241 length:825 start_codon:yes stop_codon:yes gene_type:complete